jgi:formylglycine-generating enzyme
VKAGCALVRVAALLGLTSCAGTCGRAEKEPGEAASTTQGKPRSSLPTTEGAPRPGMAWIPPGTLRAGTPADYVPRVANEEMPGEPVAMGGFYIDLLPYPNEPGAIPTTNVTRDEATQLCENDGKRLCTELEWERACKGPDNTVYEYGDAYRAATCGTGVTAEEAARRPSGEHAQCKSAFGVADMHGGVWQWTASPWGRGTKDTNLATLRGGNAVAGELVGRCANALGRPAGKKSPTMGLRCCAGEANEAEVSLTLGAPAGLTGSNAAALAATWKDDLLDEHTPAQGWTWIPVPNEKLDVVITCKRTPRMACDILFGRSQEDARAILARVHVQSGVELARIGPPGKLRIRALDERGTFSREITYVYGRVEIADAKRP